MEIAQVPNENKDEFKSVSKFKIFNTNNLWMNLKAVHELTLSNQIEMEVIVNNKVCVFVFLSIFFLFVFLKRLGNGTNVIQLETACGAGIKSFSNAIGNQTI